MKKHRVIISVEFTVVIEAANSSFAKSKAMEVVEECLEDIQQDLAFEEYIDSLNIKYPEKAEELL